MRVITFCLITVLLSCQNQKGKKNNSEKSHSIDKLETKEILNYLFEGNYVDSIKMTAWKPDFIEQNLFQVSDDGKCYSSIDTIIKNDNYRVVIMSTSLYDKKSNYTLKCNACFSDISIAAFYQDSGTWILESFIPKAFRRLTETTYLSYFNIDVNQQKLTFIKTENQIRLQNNSYTQNYIYDLSGNLVFEYIDDYDDGTISTENNFKIVDNKIEINSNTFKSNDNIEINNIKYYSYSTELMKFIIN